MTDHQTPASTRIARVFTTLTDPGARRVLIVDDDEFIRVAMGKFLRSRGFDVGLADAGASALAMLQVERFDAMLCDVRMPGMSGVEVVPKALEIAPDLAILMLTAVNDAPTATETLAQGAMDYLMKPVELDDLARAVERALHKRSLEIHQRNVERLIREEVALRTGELERQQQALAEISVGIVRALVTAQEAKDVFRRGHSQRVEAMAAAVASAMRLPAATIEGVRLAGQFHDVGTIGLSESLLHKPSALSAEEFAQVRGHVRIGIEILSPLPPLARALPAIQDHHEHWDGSGYPRGLVGEAIAIGGRILHAVDAFDALTSHRPWREPLSPQDAIERLAPDAGSQFDPAVFEALRRVVLQRNSLPFIDEAS